MPGILHYELKGHRDAQGRFARRSEMLVVRQKRAMQRSGKIAVRAYRKHAPRDSGKFAKGFFYRSYDRGYRSFVRVYPGGEHGYLFDWIVEGTAPHPIPKGGSAAQLAKGYPLSFYWEKGPRGPGQYAFWSVNHPGTEPNPFDERALAEAGPKILEELRAVAASVARLR